MTKNDARQSMLWAIQTVTYADCIAATSGVAFAAVEVPQNAVVMDGRWKTDTVWDSATSDTLDIGDGVDPDRYTTSSGPLNLQTANLVHLLEIDCYKYLAQDNIDVLWTAVGAAPTQGSGRLIVGYIVDGRAHNTQG